VTGGIPPLRYTGVLVSEQGSTMVVQPLVQLAGGRIVVIEALAAGTAA
jgi:sensor c-di-GMP phosphodiesterase-like protein